MSFKTPRDVEPTSKIFLQDRMIDLKNIEVIRYEETATISTTSDKYRDSKNNIAAFYDISGVRQFILGDHQRFCVGEGSLAYEIVYQYLKYYGWNEKFKRACYSGYEFVGTYYA